MRKPYKILIGTSEGKGLLGRTRRSSECKIKFNFEAVVCEVIY